jgi:hypothetical protein
MLHLDTNLVGLLLLLLLLLVGNPRTTYDVTLWPRSWIYFLLTPI